MANSISITFKTYKDLSIAQAVQVECDYPKNTDPHLYLYAVSIKTGLVTDRFKIKIWEAEHAAHD